MCVVTGIAPSLSLVRGSSLGPAPPWRGDGCGEIAGSEVQERFSGARARPASLAAGQDRSRWKLGDDVPLRCGRGYGWCMATERPSHDQVTEATASAEASMRPQVLVPGKRR